MIARAVILILAVASLPWVADAAEEPDTAALEALAETLESDAGRADLVARLNALIAARETARDTTGDAMVAALSDRLSATGRDLGEAARALAAAPAAAAALLDRAGEPGALASWAQAAARILLALAGAALAHAIAVRLSRRTRAALAERPGDSGLVAGVLYTGQAVLVVMPPTAFLVAGSLLLVVADPPTAARAAALALVVAIAAAEGVAAVARLVFAPAAARWRLVPMDDETAARIVARVRRLAVVAAAGFALGEAALAFGLSAGAHAVWLKLVGAAVAALLVAAIAHGGRRAAGAGGARTRLAELWRAPAVLYVLAVYGVWAIGDGNFAFLARAAVTAALVPAGFALVAAVGALAARRVPRLRGALAVFVGAAVAVLLAEIWLGGAVGWASSAAGRAVVGPVVSIAFVLGAALIVWELLSAFVARAAAHAGGARARTLLPLTRNAARVALVGVVALTVLSELGVDIGPLLAGAGIAGIAIGFGAQSLVKDVITGVFILLEDSIAVGDVVDVGGHAGVVEGMTVRTVRLRDLSGDLHFVPFGDVASVRNMTRDFSYALIDAGVAYKEDTDRVTAKLREIGEDMRGDPDFEDDILEPLNVLGLDSFGDSAVNIRVRLKTRPNRQWRVRREFHRRMKRVFDQENIEIPFPHRTLVIAGGAATAVPTDGKGGTTE